MRATSAASDEPSGGELSGSSLFMPDGSAVEVGPLLARAGEGSVYALAGRRDLVAKVFHVDLPGLRDKLDKVTAMTDSPPAGAVQSDGFTVLTWPQELVALGCGDAAAGYLMARIDLSQAVEIHSLSNPSTRRHPLPSAPRWITEVTWSQLVNTAANLCVAVQVVHRVNAVIGDLQERNILVTDTTRVTLVDCDSMQFIDAGGRQYLSPLGRPEFTAPELAGVDLRTTARRKESDLFALAVHIHLLLMAGNHPFMRGNWTGPGEQPDALVLAQNGEWAGGPGSRLHSHPLAPPVGFLPAAVRQLFVRAFTNGATDPEARPSPAEWREALGAVQITSCTTDPDHEYPSHNATCPWCEIDAHRSARRTGRSEASAVEPPKDPARQRRSRPVYTAVVSALTIGVAGLGIAAYLTRSEPSPIPTPPAPPVQRVPTVAAGALQGLLLRPEQLDTAVGTTGMSPTRTISTLPDGSGQVPDKACVPLEGAGQATVYAGSGFTAVAGQEVADDSHAHLLEQIVVSYASAQDARAFFAASTERWPACGDRDHDETTAAGQPQVHTVGAVSNANGNLSATVTGVVGRNDVTGVCERALTVANNVVIDIDACAQNPSGAAVAIADQVAAKVPTT